MDKTGCLIYLGFLTLAAVTVYLFNLGWIFFPG